MAGEAVGSFLSSDRSGGVDAALYHGGFTMVETSSPKTGYTSTASVLLLLAILPYQMAEMGEQLAPVMLFSLS